MQASRLLSILMLLQTRGRMSAQSLAAEMDVSVRTIYRDVDQLSASGVPVWADRGRLGGFQLQPGWRTQLTGLTPAEAQAVFMAGLPGPASQLGLGDALGSAQLKLLAALPPGWQDDAQRVSSRFHLDPVDWYRDPSPIDHLPAVARAVWTEQRLKIRYESWQGEVEREIDPLGLVLKAGTWYVVARASGKVRTYRLSNIRKLEGLGEPFRRPREFSLEDYWRESTRRFEAELYRDTALLRASARGLKRLRNLSVAVAAAIDGAKARPDAQGWSRVTIPIESIEHAAGQLLALGPEVEALAPDALRQRLADLARRTAALYHQS